MEIILPHKLFINTISFILRYAAFRNYSKANITHKQWKSRPRCLEFKPYFYVLF